MKEYISHEDDTEDGDLIMLRTIEADNIEEAREATRMLNNEVTRHGTKAHYDIKWIAKGGKLVWTDTYVVDAVEVAIERHNDYIASMRADEDRPW